MPPPPGAGRAVASAAAPHRDVARAAVAPVEAHRAVVDVELLQRLVPRRGLGRLVLGLRALRLRALVLLRRGELLEQDGDEDVEQQVRADREHHHEEPRAPRRDGLLRHHDVEPRLGLGLGFGLGFGLG